MRILLTVILLTLLAFPLFAQMTGGVTGIVADGEGIPLEDARVVLHSGGHGGGHGGMMGDYEVWTDAVGSYMIEDVSVGDYESRAMLMGYGMDVQEIEIIANQTITVNFTLGDSTGGGHMGGHWMHGWEEVELNGWAIVEQSEFNDFYFLDEENDGEADYLLGFGPPGYEPPSGAELPENGEEIEIVGGLMTMGEWMFDVPMVMVFELNGELWFEADSMGHHNGFGGGWHGEHGCTYEEPELTAAEGWSIVDNQGGMRNMYWLDEDDDQNADFRLDFGADTYDPGNGATRPDNGDWVEIVGGLIEGCPTAPTIVVYEINGIFWREPGDTTGLGPDVLSVGDRPSRQIPDNHLIVEAYPNPFNPSTTISVTIPTNSKLKVSVFDIVGRKIASYNQGSVTAGTHQISIDANDWATGVYFIRVSADGISEVRKIHLVK